MLKVGINENALLTNVVVTPAAANVSMSLDFEWNGDGTAAAAPTDLFAALVDGTPVNTGGGNTLKLFGASLDSLSNGSPATPKIVVGRIQNVVGVIKQVLKQYLGEFPLNPLNGVQGITNENFNSAIMQPNILAAINLSVFTQAADLFKRINPQALAQPMRLLCVRQSATKHFAAFRKSDLHIPFIEPMSVPVENTQLTLTEWEIKTKKNDGTPVQTQPENYGANPMGGAAAAMMGGGNPMGARPTQVATHVPQGAAAAIPQAGAMATNVQVQAAHTMTGGIPADHHAIAQPTAGYQAPVAPQAGATTEQPLAATNPAAMAAAQYQQGMPMTMEDPVQSATPQPTVPPVNPATGLQGLV